MPSLTVPISDEEIRALRVGDTVFLNGIIVTGRDAAHKFMIENYIRNPNPSEELELYAELKRLFNGGIVYHCGPVVKKHEDGSWSFVAAGPTTSTREEVYQAEVIEHFKLRGVIGKGGMGENTSKALQEHGAVYLHAIGGAGALSAQAVNRVKNVYMLEELGTPEAFWEIEVEGFKATVTMDSHGGSLHKEILSRSLKIAFFAILL